MSKTAIQLVNLVGQNLRRSTGSTYTSLTQDGNAVFIFQAIQEAKAMVEDDLMAWDWDGFRTQVTFSSVASQEGYDLSSVLVATPVTNERSRVARDQQGRFQFWDVTDTGAYFRLSEDTRDCALNTSLVSATDVAKPGQVAVYTNGIGLTAYFGNAPSGVRNYRLEVIQPQADLSLTTDILIAPYRPVILAATAIACEERGEELGMSATRWWDQYHAAMDAILGRDTNAADLVLIPE